MSVHVESNRTFMQILDKHSLMIPKCNSGLYSGDVAFWHDVRGHCCYKKACCSQRLTFAAHHFAMQRALEKAKMYDPMAQAIELEMDLQYQHWLSTLMNWIDSTCLKCFL